MKFPNVPENKTRCGFGLEPIKIRENTPTVMCPRARSGILGHRQSVRMPLPFFHLWTIVFRDEPE
jgi:hypothetical protein